MSLRQCTRNNSKILNFVGEVIGLQTVYCTDTCTVYVESLRLLFSNVLEANKIYTYHPPLLRTKCTLAITYASHFVFHFCSRFSTLDVHDDLGGERSPPYHCHHPHTGLPSLGPFASSGSTDVHVCLLATLHTCTCTYSSSGLA